MHKRAFGALAALLLTLSLSACGASEPKVQGVQSVAVIGDSISQASTTCQTLVNCPENSWATGSNTQVDSIVQRIQRDESTTVAAYNDAVPGARMADLQTQAQAVVGQRPDLVVILAGANDYCATSTDSMTASDGYQQQITQVLSTINAALPATRIYVASVPAPLALYDALKGNARAQQVWAFTGTCQSLLAAPTDTSVTAEAQRQLVATRANEYNTALQQACAAATNCHYDGGAVTDRKISEGDISTIDFFHPSLQGQRRLAGVAWDQGGLRDFLATAPNAQG